MYLYKFRVYISIPFSILHLSSHAKSNTSSSAVSLLFITDCLFLVGGFSCKILGLSGILFVEHDLSVIFLSPLLPTSSSSLASGAFDVGRGGGDEANESNEDCLDSLLASGALLFGRGGGEDPEGAVGVSLFV